MDTQSPEVFSGLCFCDTGALFLLVWGNDLVYTIKIQTKNPLAGKLAPDLRPFDAGIIKLLFSKWGNDR